MSTPPLRMPFMFIFLTVYQPAVGFFDDFEQRNLNKLWFTLDDFQYALSQASLGNGFEKLPDVFLRMTIDSLIYHVMILFQSINETSTFPKLWKKVMIILFFKTGSKFRVQCYRPISNLSKLSLVFEQIIFDALYPFIIKRLSPRQFWFMKKRSKITQLILYHDEIYKAHDKDDDVFCLYLDFNKLLIVFNTQNF